MKYSIFIIIFSLASAMSSELNASNLEKRYRSISLEYGFSEGDVEGYGFQYGLTFQLTGKENSGFAFLLSGSSTTIDRLDKINLSSDGAQYIGSDQTTFGFGYIIKNPSWHIVPYFGIYNIEYELAGRKSAYTSLDAYTIGLLLRTDLSSIASITIGISSIDVEDTKMTVTANQILAPTYIYDVYLGGRETVLGLDFDFLISESILLNYGISLINDENRVNSFGLTLSF